MNASPLQLEHYEFHTINVEIDDDYQINDDGAVYPIFHTSVVHFQSATTHDALDVGDGQSRFTITHAIKAKPIKPGSFPYAFEIVVRGVVNGTRLPAEKREALAVVNGASLLYGVCRDTILNLTLRMGNGPVMLPSVQLTQLMAQFKASATGSESEPANTAEGQKRLKKSKVTSNPISEENKGN